MRQTNMFLQDVHERIQKIKESEVGAIENQKIMNDTTHDENIKMKMKIKDNIFLANTKDFNFSLSNSYLLNTQESYCNLF